MYSKEQRRIAIETFIRFDHSYADTIAELGYPDRHSLRNWWREYRETGEVPVPKLSLRARHQLARAVVDQDDLQVAVGLREDAIQRPPR